MRRTLSISFLTALVTAAALLAGCGSSGIGDVLGGPRDPDRIAGDVRGTVESVDTRNRLIVVDSEASATYLRGGEDDEVVLHYDDSTRVDYQGRTYRPEDLERGDRIVADVEQTSGDRLYAQDIQVLYDVSGGTGGSLGDDLRGVVRYVDTRDRMLEIVPSSYDSRFSTGRSDVVVVYYDSQTVVEYQGRRYAPENLERGDEIEVDVRDSGGQLIAEQIVVIGEDRTVTR
jgi:hypothetical protein